MPSNWVSHGRRWPVTGAAERNSRSVIFLSLVHVRDAEQYPQSLSFKPAFNVPFARIHSLGVSPGLNQRTRTMRLLTVKELSELLNIKAKTLYQWAELNQIPHMKLNGALRFDYDDIMAWVRVCKRETSSRYNQIIQAGGSERRAE